MRASFPKTSARFGRVACSAVRVVRVDRKRSRSETETKALSNLGGLTIGFAAATYPRFDSALMKLELLFKVRLRAL
jgi:hypothetical protein